MNTTAAALRYQLPKKAIKSDCPGCGPKHRRTLSRYVDTRTGEPLPEPYGRCDRESNCGYHLSPYYKTASGLSYADEVYQYWKADNHAAAPRQHGHRMSNGKRPDSMSSTRNAVPPSAPAPIYSIPDEVFSRSIGHYDKNQLARLLSQQLGQSVASELLQRFHVGTSARWPGACVFWYIDEQNRKRGGQIKLFGPDWHTAKKSNGKSKTSWVHSALTYRLEKGETGTQERPLPDWLVDYNQCGECSPCLFGLPQLLTAPVDMPVAIVEAPKTAIVCTAYLPDFIWLAVGALSYLNAERLRPIRGRKIVLYPDLNAYYDRVNEQGQAVKGWLSRADELRANGFHVEVSDFLEQRATDEQKQAGLDLADFLLQQTPEPDTTGPALSLVPSTNRPLAEVIARCLARPADAVPLYKLARL